MLCQARRAGWSTLINKRCPRLGAARERTHVWQGAGAAGASHESGSQIQSNDKLKAYDARE